ncbi:hypothetical protein jhhlp_003495 [Lomentospora prolificans]|uniref:Uncharacterized protein n=1 Tax=Lomentospora prolificans TaxID=41688 RepID=A0A2N3N934_9PEZI|nr:hypothetical protein jhhlp_003495 [Lomentospora prolificans]
MFSSKTAKPTSPEEQPEAPPTPPEKGEKPLPVPRPGTSGTLANLMDTRRDAAQKLKHARRAERTYRTRKHATIARADLAEARAHYAEAGRHLGLAVKLSWAAVRGVPAVVGEKGQGLKSWWGEQKKKRAAEERKRLEEERKRLEEKLAKEQAEEEGEEEKEEEEEERGEKEKEKKGKGKGKGKA